VQLLVVELLDRLFFLFHIVGGGDDMCGVVMARWRRVIRVAVRLRSHTVLVERHGRFLHF